ncbi:alpha/beta hydrolase [Roseibium alexandrii]|uniref:Esterase/lipase superfamily enzyme n=1 Tax=Roseibium alexandrii (strain DSM 17067 / NCIMB 14079 / DFL-11) TaxID=244592 RepID=A0A5E8H4Y3_ROSAD|nr:alpha/beta fold hydrolase [Roseibium alexandrii]EEE47584.1 Uncharacterized protein SADFL11_4873 [Roseibium alexandrii DFL-11]
MNLVADALGWIVLPRPIGRSGSLKRSWRDAFIRFHNQQYAGGGRLVCLALAGFLLAACAGPPAAIIGLSTSAAFDAAVPGLVQRDIYIMTSREMATDPALLFSGDRSPNLNLAKVRVTIPPNHETGEIERPTRLPPDPKDTFTIVDPKVFSGSSQFVADLRINLKGRRGQARDILVFVHGFNTTLTDAVLRAAQFVNDTGFTGVPVVFSWPSKGSTFDYVYDLNSALAARDRLIAAGDLLLAASPAGVDIVAHSMGNFLTMEAIRQAALQGRLNSRHKIRNIILASPDIDIDVFEEQLRATPEGREGVYVLIASNDKALGISRYLAGGVNRVGDADPERLAGLGVTVVDLSQVKDKSSIHHTKFAEAPGVVKLIGERLEAGDSLEASSAPPNQAANVIQGLANLPITVFRGAGRPAGAP